MRHFYDLPQDEPDPLMPSLPPRDGVPAPRYTGFGFYGNRVLGSNPFRKAGKTVKN